MNINFENLIPADLSENSRVWVYQSNRAFTIPESLQIEKILQDFLQNWTNHEIPVKGYAKLFFDHFIILVADVSAMDAGSFSTEDSIGLIKNIEREFGVELFDRQMLAFIIQERIQLLPLARLNPSIDKELITENTLYFNNTVLTKKELQDNWIIPLKDSWLAIRVSESNEAEIES